MKQLQLNGYTLGVVDVPERAGRFILRASIHTDYGSISFFDKWNDKETIVLIPKGQWSILGRLNDITEEQAAGLVEEMWNGYKDYDIPNKQMAGSLPKAFESLQSFFRSHGIEGNPLVLLKKTIMKNEIPTQFESPNGLHQRYLIKKLVIVEPKPVSSIDTYFKRRKGVPPSIKAVRVDKNAEYFVMRLDEGGKDINHVKACRIGVHAYADAIEPFIPELAKDLRERYPLL